MYEQCGSGWVLKRIIALKIFERKNDVSIIVQCFWTNHIYYCFFIFKALLNIQPFTFLYFLVLFEGLSGFFNQQFICLFAQLSNWLSNLASIDCFFQDTWKSNLKKILVVKSCFNINQKVIQQHLNDWSALWSDYDYWYLRLTISAAILYLVTTKSSAMVGRGFSFSLLMLRLI